MCYFILHRDSKMTRRIAYLFAIVLATFVVAILADPEPEGEPVAEAEPPSAAAEGSAEPENSANNISIHILTVLASSIIYALLK